MLNKVVSYGLVGLLAVALVAGMAYILVRPTEANAEQGPTGRQGQARASDLPVCAGDEAGQGYRGRDGGAAGEEAGQGYRGGRDASEERGQGFGGGSEQARSGFEETGEGVGLDHPVETWTSVSGTVVSVDQELILRTEDGEVTVGLGPTWYREDTDFVLDIGDAVVVTGFYEGEEFEAGAIENVSTGDTLDMRDETGRPLWAGRGRWGR